MAGAAALVKKKVVGIFQRADSIICRSVRSALAVIDPAK
jgi:hypothetical protein